MWADSVPERGMMKKLLIILICIVSVAMICAFGPIGGAGGACQHEYQEGVNDALDTIILLDLELDLKGERKNWGEMAEIVRERLGVED